ncbi:hypothetical protein [Paraburkholderia sp.]|uniref:hypothetical protein n=1 Tax=Paraburkholderia sp. TaxID=1926495 RepID=UPI00239D1CD1|nr:hypothetical protein [Paraburkholderia sp.]MDE1180269.1 hypothetical protein [Paraburkholderia sp.]
MNDPKTTGRTPDHAGKAQDERFGARTGETPRSLEPPGGEMAKEGTQADASHGSGELSARGKEVWRKGAGLDGGGRENERKK